MEIAEQDAVMSNILSNACAGEWAWPKGLAVRQTERLRGGGRSLPGFSAVMQSLQWLTAVDFLKILQGNVEVDAISPWNPLVIGGGAWMRWSRMTSSSWCRMLFSTTPW